MTISNTTNRTSYLGNGATTAFAYPFRVFDASDLKVYFDEVLQSGGYTVAGVNDASGTVNFSAAPASGVVVLLLRDVPATQLTDYVSNDAFPAETHERALDRLTVLSAQLRELAQTALRVPLTEGTLAELPAAATRAGQYQAYDSLGAPTLVATQPAGPGDVEAYWWGGAATGTAAAHVVTVAEPPTAYEDGQRFTYLAPAASTGAATVNINSLGAIPIRKGDGTTALSASDIPATAAPVSVVISDSGTVARLLNITSNVDLSAYAALAGTASFTEPQTISTTDTGAQLTVRSSDSGALSASLDLDRNSSGPADDDILFDILWRGRDDAAANRTLARIRTLLRDATAATAEGELQLAVLIAGTLTQALALRNGLVVGGATGGFQGTGSVNASTYFRNGAALPFQQVFTSAAQAMTAGGLLTIAHGLGVKPAWVEFSMVCGITQANWAVNDVIECGSGSNIWYTGAAHAGWTCYTDATNIYVRFHLTNVALILDKTTGAAVVATPASWQLVAKAVA